MAKREKKKKEIFSLDSIDDNFDLVNINSSSDTFYTTEYYDDFPVGAYFINKYKSIFSTCAIEHDIELSFINDITSAGYKLIWTRKKFKFGKDIPFYYLYEKEGIILLLSFVVRNDDYSTTHQSYELPSFLEEDEFNDADLSSVTPNYIRGSIFYSDKEKFEELKILLQKNSRSNDSKSKISLLISTKSGFTTIPQNIKNTDIDISLNYGEKFTKVHDKIVERLNEPKGKGLVLLHGLPGTGKTSYIRNLCKTLNKEVIFLPPFLAENISNPDFVPFLLEHTNSVLIIEDAEKVILDRDSEISNRQSVSNILNMTDGLLSDCLSIQIVATFNTSRDRIDKALLRKGRLIAEWKFDALSVEESNKLLASLGKDYVTSKPMTLSEIYNLEEEVNVVQKEISKIGFI